MVNAKKTLEQRSSAANYWLLYTTLSMLYSIYIVLYYSILYYYCVLAFGLAAAAAHRRA